jgi:hypothetical protein
MYVLCSVRSNALDDARELIDYAYYFQTSFSRLEWISGKGIGMMLWYWY